MTLRERINSDPKLQIMLGALLLAAVAFIFLGKGGGEETTAEEPAAAVSESGAALETAVPVTAEAGGEASLATLGGAVPAPPMPPKVKAAYEANKVVTILFVHDGGIDDRLVKKYATLVHSKFSSTKARGHIAFFVVSARDIAKYGAITLGLGIQRVPAFVVLRPKILSKSGPQASVLYGYQDPTTIAQAILDSVYYGPEAAYHPG